MADLAAVQRNRARQKDTDRVWSAEDLLRVKYRLPTPRYINTEEDTDHGAQGDWKALRENLKGRPSQDEIDMRVELED